MAGIDPDTVTEWRKDPEFSGAIKKACALRLQKRLARIEEGAPGWQGVAWALERRDGETLYILISRTAAADLARRSTQLCQEAEALLAGR